MYVCVCVDGAWNPSRSIRNLADNYILRGGEQIRGI